MAVTAEASVQTGRSVFISVVMFTRLTRVSDFVFKPVDRRRMAIAG